MFPNTQGGPLQVDNIRHRVWYPTIAQANIRPRELYQTRHTFASQLLKGGAPIPWVAELMGHANTKMVIQRYWKYIPDDAPHHGGDYLEHVRRAMGELPHANRP